MTKLKSVAGKIHIKHHAHGTLCNSFFCFLNPGTVKSEELVTCKHCLKVYNKLNPNRESSLMLAESFIPELNKYIEVEVIFPEFSTRVTEPFKTEEERDSYIKGIKNARCWANFDAIIKINGEVI